MADTSRVDPAVLLADLRVRQAVLQEDIAELETIVAGPERTAAIAARYTTATLRPRMDSAGETEVAAAEVAAAVPAPPTAPPVPTPDAPQAEAEPAPVGAPPTTFVTPAPQAQGRGVPLSPAPPPRRKSAPPRVDPSAERVTQDAKAALTQQVRGMALLDALVHVVGHVGVMQLADAFQVLAAAGVINPKRSVGNAQVHKLLSTSGHFERVSVGRYRLRTEDAAPPEPAEEVQ